MTYLEIFIIAISLSADTLAVSLSGGMSLKNISKGKEAKVLASFALFQSLFLVAGLLVGESSLHYIEKWDHWIALIILSYIGGKMVCSIFSSSQNTQQINLLSVKTLVLMSIATSIDAVAVGFSLAVFEFSFYKILFTFFITFTVTAIASKIGIMGGSALAKSLGNKAEFIGGIVLILIGIRIFFLNLL